MAFSAHLLEQKGSMHYCFVSEILPSVAAAEVEEGIAYSSSWAGQDMATQYVWHTCMDKLIRMFTIPHVQFNSNA